jgi:hypothetical protein
MDFDLLEVWISKLTLEHQVDVDNYEGQKDYFLHFDVFCCLSLNFLNGLIGLLKHVFYRLSVPRRPKTNYRVLL